MITDFYEAKRALVDANVHPYGVGGALAILNTLGYPRPEKARDADGRVVKVYRTEGYHLRPLLPADVEFSGSRSVYEPDLPVYVVATSKKVAVDAAGRNPLHLGSATRVTVEIAPEDYRYHLVASAPAGSVLAFERDREFGTHVVLDVNQIGAGR